MKQSELIKELKAITLNCKQQAEKWKSLDDELLNFKTAIEKWSVLECVEHLNRYSYFYLPELEKQVLKCCPNASENDVKTSYLGKYFIQAVSPVGKTMKTFQVMNPTGSHLEKTVLDQFLEDQQRLLGLLDEVSDKDINSIRTAISISKWIRLRFSTTIQVLVFHNLRHIQQAEKVLNGN